MRSKFLACLFGFVILGWATAEQWQLAVPGYQYQFPRDHFEHRDYQTEWWYYTGNLRDADGHRFGFELTFFRQGTDAAGESRTGTQGVWSLDQLYLAHFALSDIDGKKFFHRERLNRAGPGLAGADIEHRMYWNGNWHARWVSLTTGDQALQAVSEGVKLTLLLKPEKPLVIHGRDGISRKGPEPGQASHYLSYTRLAASGELQWGNATHAVNGLAWMDHEFFSGKSDSRLVGWDWFAIQLNNNQELMLYRLRTGPGTASPFSSGTFVDATGKAHFLEMSQFSLTNTRTWTSPDSGARYPMAWRISVPSLGLRLDERTGLEKQELLSKSSFSPTYWEGAVTYTGQMQSRPVDGVGYLEMTGYAKPFHLGSE